MNTAVCQRKSRRAYKLSPPFVDALVARFCARLSVINRSWNGVSQRVTAPLWLIWARCTPATSQVALLGNAVQVISRCVPANTQYRLGFDSAQVQRWKDEKHFGKRVKSVPEADACQGWRYHHSCWTRPEPLTVGKLGQRVGERDGGWLGHCQCFPALACAVASSRLVLPCFGASARTSGSSGGRVGIATPRRPPLVTLAARARPAARAPANVAAASVLKHGSRSLQ